MSSRIVVAGASGFIGNALLASLRAEGDEVTTVGRSGHVRWGDTAAIIRAVDGADVVVNLAGKSVDCRSSPRNRAEIYRSRLLTTGELGAAIGASVVPPPLWINASTATIYRHARVGFGGPQFDGPWVGTRDKRMAGAFHDRRHSRGRLRFSGVHIDDVLGSIRFLRDHELEGPVNVVAPGSVEGRQLMRSLRTVLGVPFGMPLPRVAFEVGALALRHILRATPSASGSAAA